MTEPERPVALVTGGSSGIGLALAERLAGRGMTVLLAARGEARLQAAVERVPGSVPLVADVSQAADRELLVAAVRRHGRLDLLVNNAGASGGATAIDIDVARASRVLEINFLAHVGLTRALWGSLLASRGAVVNVSSGLGTYVHPQSAAYAASKHALTGWSRALRVKGLREGVHVLTLNPGPVSTAQFPHVEMARRRFARHLLIDAARCADDALRRPRPGTGRDLDAPRLSPDRERAVDRARVLRAVPRAAIPVATRTDRCRRSCRVACRVGSRTGALVVCWMYSLSASDVPSLRCSVANCLCGSRWKATKNSPASSSLVDGSTPSANE